MILTALISNPNLVKPLHEESILVELGNSFIVYDKFFPDKFHSWISK